MSKAGEAPQFYTIGVYGFTAETFFGALEIAGIDTFCDIRRRRGVRGHEYAFANANRLQAELDRLGIRYLHFLDLAPSDALRERQHTADEAAHVARRKREELSPGFVAGYRKEILSGFDSNQFLAALGSEAHKVALCCVERGPRACHRSLLAERLERDLGVEVTHLMP